MKLFYKFSLLIVILSIWLYSCKKDDEKSLLHREWNVVPVDYDLQIIDDVRNDGIRRVYNYENHNNLSFDITESVYENGWEKAIIYESDTVPVYLTTSAACKDDELKRLYGSAPINSVNNLVPQRLFEIEYKNHQWDTNLIYRSEEYTSIITSTKIYNQNKESLVISDSNDDIATLTYNGQEWVKKSIHSFNPDSYFYNICIGDGRNSGKNNIYVTTSNSELIEFSWENDQWNELLIDRFWETPGGVPMDHQCITVAPISSSLNAIYLTDNNSEILEYAFEDGNWIKKSVIKNATVLSFGLIAADGRNDGVNRLYCVSGFGLLFEISFINNAWLVNEYQFDSYNALTGIKFDNWRNDGINHLYVYQFQLGTFELTKK